MTDVTESPLGKTSSYISLYQKDLLFPLPRQLKRSEINVPAALPFSGADDWTGYEISWLNPKGKPVVCMGEFTFPCTTPNIIESKSFKLYLNSFNHSAFDSEDLVEAVMREDLSAAAGGAVSVRLTRIDEYVTPKLQKFSGVNLDYLDVICDTYAVQPDFLTVEDELVSETLFSDLLKSNCLVTGQPDWGSVKIDYRGKKIQRSGLLKYIVSFRNHNEFHEQCVERIFMDISQRCAPEQLSVTARYTRRGGLDINPYRSTQTDYQPEPMRLCRQ